MPASLRGAYEAQSEAILSHQTLISFMRDEDEVGWLFGPRYVGPGREVPEKGVRQVYVLVAVPGELPLVRLTMATNWVSTRDHSKRAFNYVRVCELLERYNCIYNEVKEIKEGSTDTPKYREDVVTSQLNKLYSLMPYRTGLLFLPYDDAKANRAEERGIGDIKPVIDSISPSSGPCNLETQVLIEGKNFDYQAHVEVDGKDVCPVTLINRELLLATLPPSKDGPRAVTVRVVTTMGVSQERPFKYDKPVPMPQIKSIQLPTQPSSVDQPVSVTVSGYNFDSGAKVFVDGKEVNTRFISAKELVADFPPDLRGRPVSVKVHNPQDISPSRTFTCP
jgi:hypothetical protein